MGYTQGTDLIYILKEVLGALEPLLPQTVLVCSELLPHPKLAFQPGAPLEDVRTTINGVIKQYMVYKGQRFIEHPYFDVKCQALYVSSGDYLSSVGLDLFNNTLMDSLSVF